MESNRTSLNHSPISAKSGSSHPSVHSQCASKKVITAPFAALAPNNLQGDKMLNNEEFIGCCQKMSWPWPPTTFKGIKCQTIKSSLDAVKKCPDMFVWIFFPTPPTLPWWGQTEPQSWGQRQAEEGSSHNPRAQNQGALVRWRRRPGWSPPPARQGSGWWWSEPERCSVIIGIKDVDKDVHWYFRVLDVNTTVLRSVVHASLWKTITTEVVGSRLA